MKIIKDTKTSLLLKSFLLNNQDYLSISVLYYFDFNNPDLPLEEQAMYRESSKQLDKTLLDYAMPKPNAEVLLCGSCHNPLPNEGASHVKLSVAAIAKELFVFGERRWEDTLITKPLAFQTIPLDFQHALPHDNLLPNIEDPNNLTTDKSDDITPAGFMPRDITTKENRKKLGTYDEKWKRELWPGFAADMDYSFFNVAPKDQQINGFLEGGESIKLLNMHPKKPQIISSIPHTSFRCFATKVHKDKEDEFKEVQLQRDTLWLFPEIERGIVIFRGTLEISDEIYSDIKYLNIKPVFVDEKLKTLDEYYELQKKELNKSVEFDETPFEEADAKIKEAKKEVFDIPRQAKEIIQKTQGKRPSLKRTTAEKTEQSFTRIDNALKRIDNAKIKMQTMKDEFGHIAKIDVDALDKAKTDLLASKEKIATALQKADSVVAQSKKMKADALLDIEKIKQNPKIPDEAKEKMGFDFLKEKERVWSDYAFDFVSQSVKNLEKEPDALHKLRHLGLAKRTIKRSWVGFNPIAKVLKAKEWKLEAQEEIELPIGFVTTRFEEATLKSLKIDDKLILGSDEVYELFLSEENYNFPLFYLKDDLEAHLCDQEAFDICNTLVCSDITTVGDGAKEALENASVIFYLEADGVIDKLENAKQFDCGEYVNLFELHQNGVDIREQIIENLPKDIVETLPIERDISAKAIREKTKKLTDKVKVDLKAKGAKLKQDLEQERDKAIAQANELLKKKGLEPIDLTQKVQSDGFIKASEVEEHFDKAINTLKKRNGKDGLNLDEKIAELEKGKEELTNLAKKGETMYAEGMEKIAQAKEKSKDPIPDWAKEMMQKAGLDPQDPFVPDLTREKVIELHAKGESFEMKSLSNLDLSGLDLSGINLKMANCKKTNFTHTNLNGAQLEQTNCAEADFTQANLSDSEANMSVFKKSIFKKTIFKSFMADMALFENVVLKDCIFKKATLNGAIFKDVEIDGTIFDTSNFLNTSFLNSSIKNSSFNSAKMDKTLFSESTLLDCELQELDSKGMLFNKSQVHNADFSRSKLENMRILKESQLHHCNLSRCNMEKTTIFEAILDTCNLQRSILNKSLIKKSEVNNSDFRGVIAKQGRFEYSSFIESSFRGINLFRGSLRGMDMKICDFSNANLYAVEMYKTKLFEVKLDGANLKRSNLEGRVDLIGKSDD